MAFNVRCPSCANVLQPQSQLAGSQARCPVCDAALEIPTLHAVEQAGATILEGEELPVDLRKGRVRQDPEMDMTPMVDVTFLLLIFFMVTAAFSLQRAFELPIPPEDQPSTQSPPTLQDFENDPEYVVVRIDRNNTFYVVHASWDSEQEAPSEQELLVKVRESRTAGGGKGANKMLVVAHRDALHQRVIMALDAASAAGIDQVQRTRTDEDE